MKDEEQEQEQVQGQGIVASNNGGAAMHQMAELANHESLHWARHDSLDRMRHRTEFEMLGVLGRGAFGVTYKVKNKIDSQIYALKVVYLGKAVGEDDARKVLREVEVLSSLHSENVVRYYAAWIEKGGDQFISTATNGNNNNNNTSSSESGESSAFDDDAASWSLSFASTTSTGSQQHQQRDRDPVCHLCQSTYEDWEVSFEQWGLLDAVLQPKFLCTTCYIESLPNTVEISSIRIRRTTPFYLFILMEYCESTLKEAVDQIHKQFKTTTTTTGGSSNGKDDEQQRQQAQAQHHILTRRKDEILWNYFAQFIQGLEHCHSKHFIHRDVKLSNIFVHKNVVKLGDLGLATHSSGVPALGISRSSDEDSHKEEQQNDDDDDDACSQKEQKEQQPTWSALGSTLAASVGTETPSSKSSQVGTFLYTAPEVTSGKYNESCDIFSAGVVLVEMFLSFSTGMERAKVLSRLQVGELPPDLLLSSNDDNTGWVAKLAKTMVSTQPTKRPSCSQILSFLLQNKLWDDSKKNPSVLERVVTELQCKNHQLEQTIEKLRELLNANNISNDHIL